MPLAAQARLLPTPTGCQYAHNRDPCVANLSDAVPPAVASAMSQWDAVDQVISTHGAWVHPRKDGQIGFEPLLSLDGLPKRLRGLRIADRENRVSSAAPRAGGTHTTIVEGSGRLGAGISLRRAEMCDRYR
nr:hypothetical protein CFP56_42094 [Quercus suber]